MEHQFASRTAEEKNTSFQNEQNKENEGHSLPPPTLQFKSFGDEKEDEDIIQKKENKATTNPSKLPDSINNVAKKSFGQDLSNVNIRTNDKEADDLGAKAFTKGNEISFGNGEYDPSSAEGKSLIGHELAHVIQQKNGLVQPTSSINNIFINDNPHLEKQADEMGNSFAHNFKNNDDELDNK